MTMPAASEWSYGGDPAASDLDAVRFWLQDTDPDVRLLSDTEITFLIATWSDLGNNSMIFVASHAARRIAAKFAGVTSINADGVSVAMENIAPAYTVLAGQLLEEWNNEQSTGEVDISNLLWAAEIDPSLAPLRFGVGHMDNPAAGLQDYGGERWQWWSELTEWPP